jgi:hypothetical protein
MPKVTAVVVVVRAGVGTGVFTGGTAGLVVTTTFGFGAGPVRVSLIVSPTSEQPTRAAASADATTITATRPAIFER